MNFYFLDMTFIDILPSKMKQKVIIRFTGGLGNQMFQYALAKIISAKSNSEILLDKTFFQLTEKRVGHTPRKFELKIFGVIDKEAELEDLNKFNYLKYFEKIKRGLNLNYPSIFIEKSFAYDPSINSIKPPVYLRGYFQSYKYLNNNRKLITQTFSFPFAKLDTYYQKIFNDIVSSNEESLAIHVRRGDYVDDTKTNEFHGFCGLEYYLNAISKILSYRKISTVYFFSDDISWVKDKFDFLEISKYYVSNNEIDNGWMDLFLMTKCNHNIISNSSFSWWGAWLNENAEQIVIAPRVWFAKKEKDDLTNNLIPPNWLRL